MNSKLSKLTSKMKKRGKSQAEADMAEAGAEVASSGFNESIEEKRKKSIQSRNEKELIRNQIQLIMLLPEVKDELITKANPNSIDLFQSAFSSGGELESYSAHIRLKLIQLKELQDTMKQR